MIISERCDQFLCVFETTSSFLWRNIVSQSWRGKLLIFLTCSLSFLAISRSQLWLVSFWKFSLSLIKICPTNWRTLSLTREERRFLMICSLTMDAFVLLSVQATVRILRQPYLGTTDTTFVFALLKVHVSQPDRDTRDRDHKGFNQMDLWSPHLSDLVYRDLSYGKTSTASCITEDWSKIYKAITTSTSLNLIDQWVVCGFLYQSSWVWAFLSYLSPVHMAD